MKNIINQQKLNSNLGKTLTIFGLVALLIGAFTKEVCAQSVGISATAITPDAQSILDIQSVGKGVLLPRMTTVQRTGIATTSNSDFGLMVYDTDTDSYWYWNGTAWQTISVSANVPTSSDYIVNQTSVDGVLATGQTGANYDITGNAEIGGTLAINGQTTVATGNVGIGDVTPDAKLDVDAATGNLLILAQSGTQRMIVDINGNLTVSGKVNSNGIEETSDIRFKTNISSISEALESLLKLRGVTYNWRVEEFPEKAFGNKTEIGLIAQEVEKVFPELVSIDENGYRSVQYSHMVPVLLEAIKDQQKLIESLTVNMSAMQSNMVKLEAALSTKADVPTMGQAK